MTAEEELDALTDELLTLERFFVWDPPTHYFKWTGTDEEQKRLEEVRALISAHPIIVAENIAMMRAEARM